MDRIEFLTEVENMQHRHGCRLSVDAQENYIIAGGKVKVECIHVSWIEADKDCIMASEEYDSYSGLATDLDKKIRERRRDIFSAGLYETIAKNMIDTDCATFDKRIGRYQVVVERDFLFGGYADGCADLEDDWLEVENNFDSDLLTAAIEKMKAENNEACRIRFETETQLRRAA